MQNEDKIKELEKKIQELKEENKRLENKYRDSGWETIVLEGFLEVDGEKEDFKYCINNGDYVDIVQMEDSDFSLLFNAYKELLQLRDNEKKYLEASSSANSGFGCDAPVDTSNTDDYKI